MSIPTNINKINFNISFGKRLMLFLCATLLCFVIGSLIIGFIVSLKGNNPAVLRISSILQDIFVFIAPALITAIIVTRLPARFLAIDMKPGGIMRWLMPCLILIVSIPAMNALVLWNETLVLPDFMVDIEAKMRASEMQAQKSVEMLIGGTGWGSLIVSVLIVGVFAGFSEELFYRGTFLRLLTTGNVNRHLSIWLVAFVFSAMHLQFFGFFPRLLLGAYFGYLLVWTRCLWIPIIVHIFNNTLYTVGTRIEASATVEQVSINSFGKTNYAMIGLSIALVVIGIIAYRHLMSKTDKMFKK